MSISGALAATHEHDNVAPMNTNMWLSSIDRFLDTTTTPVTSHANTPCLEIPYYFFMQKQKSFFAQLL